jgi:flagellar protein FlaG
MSMDFNNTNSMAGASGYAARTAQPQSAQVRPGTSPVPQAGAAAPAREAAAPVYTLPVRESAVSAYNPLTRNATGETSQSRTESEQRYQRLNRPSESEINHMVSHVNRHLEPRDLALNFRRHEGTDRYFATIYNRETQEVVREIPSEWSLDLLATIWEMTGIFVNERG